MFRVLRDSEIEIDNLQYVEKHLKDDSDLEKLWVEAKKTEEK